MKELDNSQVERTISSLREAKSGDTKSLSDVKDKLLG